MRCAEVDPGLGPGLGVRPRSSVEGDTLTSGIRGVGIAIVGVGTEVIGSGVADFWAIISSCVDVAVVCCVAMSYGGGRALRFLSRRRRRARKKKRARRRAVPIMETGTAMAIFVVFEVPPDETSGSLVDVDVEVDVGEMVETNAAEAEVDCEVNVEDAVDNGDGNDDAEYELVASGEVVDFGASDVDVLISTAAVSVGDENAVNSLTDGHGSVGWMRVTIGSAGVDISGA
jgi:hypothetical protein